MAFKKTFSFYIMAISFLLFTNNAHYHTAYSHTENGLGSNPNWQSKLDDTIKINRVSLPGSHDTMADDDDGPSVDCQDSDLPTQLEAGIRVLDIRCRAINGVFAIHHGAYYLSINFDGVLNQCKQFLDDHPTEFIIMNIQPAQSFDHDTVQFENLLAEYINNPAWSSYFYQTDNVLSIPSVGDVRKKIYIIQTFGGYPGKFGPRMHDQYGFNHWSIAFGDYIGSLYEKWENVKKDLIRANTAPDDNDNKFYVTGLNANGGAFPYTVASGHGLHYTDAPRLPSGLTTPGWSDSYPDWPRVNCVWIFVEICTIAIEGTNILTYDYIRNHALSFVGIIYADFPGQGLINTIIDTNFREYYMAKSRLPGERCLGVHTQNDANLNHIQIEDCNPSNDAQLWQYVPATFQIKSKRDGKCLDVYGANMATGDVIGVYECNSQLNQMWFISDYIRNPVLFGCLDIWDADKWAKYNPVCYDDNRQKFDFFPASSYSPPTPAPTASTDDYLFKIISKLPGGKCLDIYDGSDTTYIDHIQIHSCDNGDNQLWIYDSSTKEIKSTRDGKCIAIYGGNMNNGDTIGVWTCNNQNNQKWLLQSNGDIKSSLGGCLDIWSGDRWAKYNTHCNGGTNQLFDAGVIFDCPRLNDDTSNPGRCGPLFGGVRCNKELVSYAIYCNEDNGWCGDTTKHQNAQSRDIYDYQPNSCILNP